MIDNLLQFLQLDRFGWRSLVDILVLAVIIYQILRIFRGTRAVRMLSGILVLVVAYILTEPGRALALPTVNRVLGALLLFAPFAIVVLFVNHIRRVLSIAGTNPFAGLARTPVTERMVEEVVLAAVTLSSKKHGALIVIEREQGLRSFAETGIALDAVVSYDLLTTIFSPHAPLHDGAVIVSEGRIRAASCFLPLTTTLRRGREIGSRHRAAIGITEETDAVALVVSEESGDISIVRDGRLRRGLEPHELTGMLTDLLQPPAARRWRRGAHDVRRAHEGEAAGSSPAEGSARTAGSPSAREEGPPQTAAPDRAEPEAPTPMPAAVHDAPRTEGSGPARPETTPRERS